MSPPRVRVTAGEHAGRVGHRCCRDSDTVYVRLRLADGTIDQVPVNEHHIKAMP
jgi:hypothetical protein